MELVNPIVEWATEKGPTVDATAIYRSILAQFGAGKSIALYEDHPCVAPAFGSAVFGWVNDYGNVAVIAFTAVDRTEPGAYLDRWDTTEPVDWDAVRWTLAGYLFNGGISQGRTFPTSGPVYGWWLAVSGDGRPLDISWIAIEDSVPQEKIDLAQLVLLGSLNFLACRNVQLVEPSRPRPERRRLDRLGVRVSEINVRPISRSTQGRGAGGVPGGGLVPLTSVAGHFASYGDAFGRGKLFGRLEGRFWIPQHARGSADHGTVDQTYILNPGCDATYAADTDDLEGVDRGHEW
jgi:hypothetical protein